MSLVWRFRSSPPLAARVVRELLNQSHTSKAHDSSVPYEPEVRQRDCRKVCANFGFGTLEELGLPTFLSCLRCRLPRTSSAT